MVVELCTDSVPSRDRPAYWRAVRREVFGDDCEIECYRGSAFRARMSVLRVGPLLLSDCRGSACAMVRAGCEAGSVTLLVQQAGECLIRQGGRQIHLVPGSFCLFPADARVALEWPGPYRQLSLRFRASLLAERFAHWQQGAYAVYPGDTGAAGIFLAMVSAMRQHGESTNGKCCVEAVHALVGLLATALDEHRADTPAPAARMASYHKARIRRFVLENLANPELDVARIADAVGLSPRYVHRLFADEPLQLMRWIWNERLERCFQVLADRACAGASVSAVAYAWGFNDASHFSRSFRKRYGISPRDVSARPHA